MLRRGANEMDENLSTYDPAEDLQSEDAIAVFLELAFDTDDASYVAHALGVAARAREMMQKSRTQ